MNAVAKTADRIAYDAVNAELLLALKAQVARADTTPARRIQLIQEAYDAGHDMGRLHGVEETNRAARAAMDEAIAKAKRS